MSRRFTSPLALAAILGVALVSIGALGCTKKPTSVDPLLKPPRFPEGVRDSAQNTPSDLVVWPDLPNPVLVDYADSSVPDFIFPAYRIDDGANVGVVLDYVGSSGYQMFRREVGGGFRRYLDFTLTASRRWADRSVFGTTQAPLVLPPSQLFTFNDPVPPPMATPGYMGRAVLAGVSGAGYPLTNLGEVSSDVSLIGGTVLAQDSLIEVQWNPVPGAAGYWLQIYRLRNDVRTSRDAIEAGLLAPLSLDKVQDLFLGYFPAAVPGYKMGSPVPIGARILVYQALQGNTIVLVRWAAVDSSGQLIAAIGTNGDIGRWLEEDAQGDRTLFFPLGAVVVEIPGPSSPTLARIPAPQGMRAVDSGLSNLVYFQPDRPGGTYRSVSAGASFRSVSAGFFRVAP